jgi:transcriptional regulator with XRE-family HTH domain
MKRRDMTTSALASAVGINARTVRNIACGSAPSRRARQAITNALGVEIWPGILPEERRLNFECGVQTESATIKEAKELAREFRPYVKRRGKVVTFIRTASFVIRYDDASAPTGKIFESVAANRQQHRPQ